MNTPLLVIDLAVFLVCTLAALGVQFVVRDTDLVPKITGLIVGEKGEKKELWDHDRFDQFLQAKLTSAVMHRHKWYTRMWYGCYKLWTCGRCQSVWAGFLSALIYTVSATPLNAWTMTFPVSWMAMAWLVWSYLRHQEAN